MVTEKDFKIIAAIQRTKNSARSKNKDVLDALVGGKIYYRKAVDAIRTSGLWTMCISILIYLAFVVKSTFDFIELSRGYEISYEYVAGYFIGGLIATLIPCLLGLKIYLIL
ncbi:hypothetical protein IKW75_01730 [Candidatus Saccharibacteria bacterium]|nr:hypothetical protein [Candidatus Saccharibacteria bacterium]